MDVWLYSFELRGKCEGPWLNVKNRYLGLKFIIKGKDHFGWARLTTTGRIALLTGYAYETIPNKPIIAGKTKGPERHHGSTLQSRGLSSGIVETSPVMFPY